jgi:hypothetical protein
MPMTFEQSLSDVFSTAYNGAGLFRYFLRKLQAEGQHTIEDFYFDFEKDYWMFLFDPVSSRLIVDYFDVTKQDGQVSLTTNSVIMINEVSEKSLNKLKEVVEEHDFKLPIHGFDYVDEVDAEIEENDETVTLRINCWMESFEELPTLKQVSQLIHQIFRKSGIKRKSER